MFTIKISDVKSHVCQAVDEKLFFENDLLSAAIVITNTAHSSIQIECHLLLIMRSVFLGTSGGAALVQWC